jgi:hypothetical protein
MRIVLIALAAAVLLGLGYLLGSDGPDRAEAPTPDPVEGSLSVEAAQRGEPLATRGDTTVTFQDVHGFFRHQIPESDRAGFLRNPRRIAQMIDNLLARHGVARMAIADGLDDDPGVEAEILHGSVNTLFQAYIDRYVEANMLDSYEDQAREAYLVDPDRFSGSPAVTFRHLLIMPAEAGGPVAAMRRILELHDQAQETPGRFDELIESNSHDPLLEQNGGLYERIEPAMLEDAMAGALEALSPGEISAPIQTRHGWHLVRLEEWHEPEEPEYEDVRDQFVEMVRQEHRAELHEGLVQRVLAQPLELPQGVIEELLERYGADPGVSNSDVSNADGGDAR